MTTLSNDELRLLLITKIKDEADRYLIKSAELGINERFFLAHHLEDAQSILKKYDDENVCWLLLVDIDDDLLLNREQEGMSVFQADSFKIRKPIIYILSSCEEDDTLYIAAKQPDIAGFIAKSSPEENLGKAFQLFQAQANQ